MSCTIMAEQAIRDVDAEKHVRGVHCTAIVSVPHGTHCDGRSHKPIRVAVCETVTFSGDQVANHFVVRFVPGDRLVDVRIEGVASLLTARNIAAVAVFRKRSPKNIVHLSLNS
jgi:hypothetical protein